MSVRKQSGLIPIRINSKNKLEILIITNPGKKGWTIPKGGLEKGLSKQRNARKEAFEEAGIFSGVVLKKIGSFEYEKGGVKQKVFMYPFVVQKLVDSWPEKHLRSRRWVSIAQAKKALRSEIKPLLDVLKAMHAYGKLDLGDSHEET